MYTLDNRKRFKIRDGRINMSTGPVSIGTVRDLLLMVQRRKLDRDVYSYNQVQRELTYRNSWSESEYMHKVDPLEKVANVGLKNLVNNQLLTEFNGPELIVEKSEILNAIYEEHLSQMYDNNYPSVLIRVAPRTWMMLPLDKFILIQNMNETAARLICYKNLKPTLLKVRK